MRTFLQVILLLVCLHFGTTVKAQHLKLSAVPDSSSTTSIFENGTSLLDKWTYNYYNHEFEYYIGGQTITNKVKFPSEYSSQEWNVIQAGDKMYFAFATYGNSIYNLFFAAYDYKKNQLGEPKLVLQTKTKIKIPSIISNTNYFMIMVGIGNNSAELSTIIENNVTVTVLDYDLEVLYSKDVQLKFSPKEFKIDVTNVLGEDGSWYRFGIKYEGKGDEIEGTYGAFITTPEGNTSEFISIPVDDLGFVSSVITTVEADKIIQYGTWSKQPEPNEMSGIYYLELSAADLQVLHAQIKTIAIPELTTYNNNNIDSKNLAKRESINSISLVTSGKQKLQFTNGNHVAVLRREHIMEGSAYAYTALFIATFGLKPEDMTIQMVRINQRIPTLNPTNRGPRVGFECGVGMLNNNLIIIFNDNIANASVISAAAVQPYKPFPGETEIIATYALIMNEKGEIRREQILSYKTDNLLFLETSNMLNNERLYIFTVNDANYDYFYPKKTSKVEQSILQFVK